MRKKILITISFIFLTFFASCKKSCSKSSTSNQEIFVSVGQPIESLDPRYASSAVAGRVSKLVFAPLFTLGDNAFPEAFLAKEVQVLNDTSFKITLKDNLYFHNGDKLTAMDVEYTYKELMSKDVLSPHQDKFDYIKEIKVIDDNTIIFELKEPHAPFILDLCLLGIVSKKSCLNRSKECRNEYNGSGPFMVKKWDTAKESLHLVPFDKWFEGPPKNDVVIRVIRDENSRTLELMSQKTDIVDGYISSSNLAELKAKDFLDITILPSFAFSYLAINLREPNGKVLDKNKELTQKALTNKMVRKAIAHSLNLDQIIEKIFQGHAQKSSGLIPNKNWAKDLTLKPIEYDPHKSNELLDAAGFKKSANGYRFGVTITVSQDRTAQNLALLYADFMKKVGIDAKVKVKDWSAMYEDMKQGNFEIFSAVWVPVTDPDMYFWVHHSSNIPNEKKAGGNRHAYKNYQVDALIEQGRKEMAPEKRKPIYHKLERILQDDLAYIPLWDEDRIIAINKKVKGYVPMSTGNLINLRKAYKVNE